jgi:8-oxo-dGTP diphosphatase
LYPKQKEMKKSAVCGIVIGDMILLLKRQYRDGKSNGWCIPGGKVEPGETTLEGAIRETFEETGIKVSDLIYVGESPSGSGEFMVSCYYTTMDSIQPVILSEREHSEYFWVTFDKLDNFIQAGNTPSFIDMIIADIKSENN